MNHQTGYRVTGCLMLIIVVAYCIAVSALFYVAIHFIRKFW